MKELQNRQRVRRIVYSIPSLIVLFLIFGFLARGTYEVFLKERESSLRAKELQSEKAALVVRANKLDKSIEALGTEEGVRDEIKSKFNVVEEDEYVAIIVDPKVEKATTTTESQSWFKRLWSAIIGQ